MIEERQEARFQELLGLPPGWLGSVEEEGESETIRPECVAIARAILDEIQPFVTDPTTPGIFPTPEGGVQMEWRLGNYASVAVRVPPDEPTEASVVLLGVYDGRGDRFTSLSCPVPGRGPEVVTAIAEATKGFLALTQSVLKAQAILLAK